MVNDELNSGEVKILYSDGKYLTISTIEAESLYRKDASFKMEYGCELR